ncbi:MAG: class I SAM-dependent methyltransferase [Leptolyngbyaceae cyanobacterium]
MSPQIGNFELCAIIRDHIAQSPEQRMTFAAFMDLALYQPDHGYYRVGSSQLGMAGDFATSAHLGPDFAELLTEQLVDMWQRLDCPDPFHVIEMGAGQGLIAAGILAYLKQRYPSCLAALRYTLIETSPALRGAQQARLARWQPEVAINWGDLTDLSPGSVTGCIFSNELVDALPVHRVVLGAEGLQEQYVVCNETEPFAFELVPGPLSTSALADYLAAVGVAITTPAYPLGYVTEINLAALTWLADVADKLHQGYLLTIDYGYAAERYYRPSRSQGTLQCYTRHAHHNEPLINIGRQDITAHVDFTALERQGDRCGLETLGNVPQELFLMALGLGDRLNQLAQIETTDVQTIRAALQRREALHQLMNPLGLGKFNVLVQAKGLTQPAQRQLKGTTMPPLTSPL